MNIIVVIDLEKIRNPLLFRETTERSLLNQTDIEYKIYYKNDTIKHHKLIAGHVKKKNRPDVLFLEPQTNALKVYISESITLNKNFISRIKKLNTAEDINDEFILRNNYGKRETQLPNYEKIYPNIILCAPPKCGTTGIYEELSMQKDITWSWEKEVPFFNSKGIHNAEEFINHFAISSKNENLLYFNPDVFIKDDVYKILKNNNPNIRMICILRNPVDRILSQYVHFKALNALIEKPGVYTRLKKENLNQLKYLRLNETWKGERRKLYEIINNIDLDLENDLPNNRSYFALSNYLPVIEKRIKLVGRENIYFMIYENLQKNYSEEMGKLYKWIVNSDHVPNFSGRHINTSNLWLNTYNPKNDIRQKDIDFLIDYYKGYDKKIGEYLGIDIDWSTFTLPDKINTHKRYS